jgi:anti-sigma B factor antagonist
MAVTDVKIEERLIGPVTVLDIVGTLTSDQAAQRLKDKVDYLVSQQRTQIVLNLKNVPHIDSGGLGQLVASYGSVMKAGGALKLLNVGPRNHDRFSITRLVTLFDAFDCEVDAVQSFETVAPPAVSRWWVSAPGAGDILETSAVVPADHPEHTAEERTLNPPHDGAEAARTDADTFRRLAEEAREVRDKEREALERTRQERERLRDTAETMRVSSEDARRAAEEARKSSEEARIAADAAREAVVAALRATADTLTASLEEMRMVEDMRRTLRRFQDVITLEPD